MPGSSAAPSARAQEQAPGVTTKGAPVTAREVRAAQALWASSIKKISKAYLDKGDFVGAAGEAAQLTGLERQKLTWRWMRETFNPKRTTTGHIKAVLAMVFLGDGYINTKDWHFLFETADACRLLFACPWLPICRLT